MPERLYHITAIVSDPSPNNPIFGGDYYKIVAKSSNPNVEEHHKRLTVDGYRVLSVKSRPYDEYTDNFLEERQDMQGNMDRVDNKSVRHRSVNDE